MHGNRIKEQLYEVNPAFRDPLSYDDLDRELSHQKAVNQILIRDYVGLYYRSFVELALAVIAGFLVGLCF